MVFSKQLTLQGSGRALKKEKKCGERAQQKRFPTSMDAIFCYRDMTMDVNVFPVSHKTYVTANQTV